MARSFVNGTGSSKKQKKTTYMPRIAVMELLEQRQLLSASVGDLVWDDLNANGLQDGGEPGLADATVQIYDSADNLIDTTSTDANGNYAFAGLVAGDYYIQFAGFNFSPQNVGADDTIDSDADPLTGQTTVFTLIDGQNDTSWDAGFYQFASVGDFVWDDLNADGIQNVGELGLSDVTIQLYDSGDNLIGTTSTDEFGNYVFTDLIPGDYYVQFTGFNFSPQNVGADDAIDSDADPLTGQSPVFTLISGEVNDTVDAGLYQFASVGDFVWDDLNANGLQDAGEPGLSDVTIQLYDSGDNLVGTTTTDEFGNYVFTDLIPGDYYVQFTGFYFSPENVGPDPALDSDADPVTGQTVVFTLISGQIDNTWDAGLYQLASVGDFVWDDINGDGIQDNDEPGLADVTVQLYDADDTLIGTTTTDEFGNYTFTDLIPNSYYLHFDLLPGYTFSPQNAGEPGSDSVVNPATGLSDTFTLISGQLDDTQDAGMFIESNVTVTVAAGQLVLVGDDFHNSVIIDQIGLSRYQFRVRPGDGSTLINGQSGSLIFSGVNVGINANFNGGDDELLVTTADVTGVLQYIGGTGDDTLDIQSTRVRGNLAVSSSGSGSMDSSLTDVTVDKALSVVTSTGNDSIALLNTVVSKTSSFLTDSGDDTLEIDNSILKGDTTFDYADGTDTLITRNSAEIRGNMTASGAGSLTADMSSTVFSKTLTITDTGAGDDVIDMVNVTVKKDAVVQTGLGDDALTLDGTLVKGSMTYDYSQGADLLTMQNAARVYGNLTVTGEGSLTASLTDTTVDKVVTFTDTGAGDDTIELTNVLIKRNANFQTGLGDDALTLDNTNIKSTMTYDYGLGDDTLTMLNASRVYGKLNVTGGGDLTATLTGATVDNIVTFTNTGAGDDTINLLGTTFKTTTSFLTGTGDDSVRVDNSIIRGSMIYDYGLGADTLTTLNGSRVYGKMTVTGAGSLAATLTDTQIDKTVTFTNSGATTIDALNLTAKSYVYITTGLGDDAITIDDSVFSRNVTLDTGAGDDAVDIETVDTIGALPATFKARLNINMNADDDVLTVAVTGRPGSVVNLKKSSLWDGGTGVNTLDLAAGQPVGKMPTIQNFQNII